jgi:hypothetical protein
MYLLTNESLGNIHIRTSKLFNELTEVQEFLSSIDNGWDKFSIAPSVFIMESGKAPKELSTKEYKELIYPYTYTSRHRKDKP